MTDAEAVKRIRLTIEWVGGCSEGLWADQLTGEIEDCDLSQTSVVVERELLTNYGQTPGIGRDRLRELGYKPKSWPPPRPLTWRLTQWLRGWR